MVSWQVLALWLQVGPLSQSSLCYCCGLWHLLSSPCTNLTKLDLTNSQHIPRLWFILPATGRAHKKLCFSLSSLKTFPPNLTPGECCRNVREGYSLKKSPLRIVPHHSRGRSFSMQCFWPFREHISPLTQRPSPLRKTYCCSYWFILIPPTSCGGVSFICQMG